MSTHRQLALRRRPDIEVVTLHQRGRRVWQLRDPIARTFFQLSEPEYFVWSRLDHGITRHELQRQFETHYAPQRLRPGELDRFLARLHREGLVIADRPGQGDALWERHRKRKLQKRGFALFQVLAIRFRGLDPDRFLESLARPMRFLALRPVMALIGLFVLSTAAFFLTRWTGVVDRLPPPAEWVAPRQVLLFAVALAGMKILHEIGHALTCKLLGGACHELGVMLLAFVPCLYCDVSDAWMMRARWKRLAVSGAGIAVEVFLASVAAWIWWWTQPGTLHDFCFAVMVIGAVNTLLWNGNPLMRYDGYYLLVDLVEVPNLWERSRALLRYWVIWPYLKRRPSDGEQETSRVGKTGLLVYAILSQVYLVLVLSGICALAVAALRPWGLEWLAWTLAVWILVGLLVAPAWRTFRLFRSPGGRANVRRVRLAVSLLFATGAVTTLLWIPMPSSVRSAVHVQLGDVEPVYVTAAGQLYSTLPMGVAVDRGDRIARLENGELRRELARFERYESEQSLLVRQLERQQVSSPAAALLLDTARQAHAQAERQLELRRVEHRRLQLHAPRNGIIVPPPYRPVDVIEGELPEWSGTPLDAENRGAYLERGTLLCRVGRPDRFDAVFLLPARNVHRVKLGARADVGFPGHPGKSFPGRVIEIAAAADRSVDHPHARRTGQAENGARASNGPTAHVLVRVRLAPDARLIEGLRGRGRIRTEPASVAVRLRSLIASWRRG